MSGLTASASRRFARRCAALLGAVIMSCGLLMWMLFHDQYTHAWPPAFPWASLTGGLIASGIARSMAYRWLRNPDKRYPLLLGASVLAGGMAGMMASYQLLFSPLLDPRIDWADLRIENVFTSLALNIVGLTGATAMVWGPGLGLSLWWLSRYRRTVLAKATPVP